MRLFKNQSYSKLRKQHQTANTLFEDAEFPATDASLYIGGKGGGGRAIEWKRPKDIADNPKLVVDGVSGNDLNQGDVGNCWFVAACATLAGVTPLWEKVVVNNRDQDWDANRPEKYTGLFRFHFWRMGEWVEVVVDDRLPTSGGHLMYLHSKDQNEFWSPLLEKAYAKLAGSYEALDAGSTGDALVDFSGGVCEKIKLDTYADNIDQREGLFTLMEKEINRNSMMSCSISAATAADREAKLTSGLLKGHAYGVTAVKLVKVSEGIFSSKKFHLLRIRNPWGKTEWNGAWSDNSEEWKNVSAKERKRLGIVFDDDGEFWMSFEDWISHYTDMSICRLLNTSTLSIRKTWHETRFHGVWEGARAGGCINNKETFLKNPHYIFDVRHDEDNAVIIDLMQEDTRSTRKVGSDEATENTNLSIGFQLFKVEENRRHRLRQIQKSAGNVTFTNTRSVFGKFTLAEGRYVCIPSTFQPGVTGDFMLRIYAEHASHAKELTLEQLKVPSWRCCAGQYTSQVCVTVHSVNGLPNQNLVSEGADPYCIVYVQGEKSQTPVIKDTLTAKFDASFVFFTKRRNAQESPVKIEVWDKNMVKDKCLGEVQVMMGSVGQPKQTTTKLHARKHPETPAQGTVTVTVEWFDDIMSR